MNRRKNLLNPAWVLMVLLLGACAVPVAAVADAVPLADALATMQPLAVTS